MKKLKGCRPSKDVMQDYSNVCAQLGDVIFQIDRSHRTKQDLLKRQRELVLEINASQAQEAEIAAQGGSEDVKLHAEPAAEGVKLDKPAPAAEVVSA